MLSFIKWCLLHLLELGGVEVSHIVEYPTEDSKYYGEDDLPKSEQGLLDPAIFPLLLVDDLKDCMQCHNDKRVDKDNNHPNIKVPKLE